MGVYRYFGNSSASVQVQKATGDLGRKELRRRALSKAAQAEALLAEMPGALVIVVAGPEGRNREDLLSFLKKSLRPSEILGANDLEERILTPAPGELFVLYTENEDIEYARIAGEPQFLEVTLTSGRKDKRQKWHTRLLVMRALVRTLKRMKKDAALEAASADALASFIGLDEEDEEDLQHPAEENLGKARAGEVAKFVPVGGPESDEPEDEDEEEPDDEEPEDEDEEEPDDEDVPALESGDEPAEGESGDVSGSGPAAENGIEPPSDEPEIVSEDPPADKAAKKREKKAAKKAAKKEKAAKKAEKKKARSAEAKAEEAAGPTEPVAAVSAEAEEAVPPAESVTDVSAGDAGTVPAAGALEKADEEAEEDSEELAGGEEIVFTRHNLEEWFKEQYLVDDDDEEDYPLQEAIDRAAEDLARADDEDALAAAEAAEEAVEEPAEEPAGEEAVEEPAEEAAAVEAAEEPAEEPAAEEAEEPAEGSDSDLYTQGRRLGGWRRRKRRRS